MTTTNVGNRANDSAIVTTPIFTADPPLIPLVPNHVQIGKTRIRDGHGFVGTIAYVGPVASAKHPSEIYVGIIWDDDDDIHHTHHDDMIMTNKSGCVDPSHSHAVHHRGGRGKHDGSVVDRVTGHVVRHFTAPHATAGSFLKWNNQVVELPEEATPETIRTTGEQQDRECNNNNNKTVAVQPLPAPRHVIWNAGRPVTPAVLQQRYVDTHSAELVAPGGILPHCALTAGGRRATKPIELLGELKIRHYQQVTDLRQMSLRRAGLCRMLPETRKTQQQQQQQQQEGSPSGDVDWSFCSHHLLDLDLAGNLFSDWSIVVDVARTFPVLQRLSVAANRIGDWTATAGIAADINDLANQSSRDSQVAPVIHESLTHLNLNHCRIESLSTILFVGQLFPGLQELAIAYCRLKLPSTQQQEQSDNDNNYNQPYETSSLYSPIVSSYQTRLATVFPRLVLLDASGTDMNNQTFHLWARLPRLACLICNFNAELDHLGTDEMWHRPVPILTSTTDPLTCDATSWIFPALQQVQFASTGMGRDCDSDPRTADENGGLAETAWRCLAHALNRFIVLARTSLTMEQSRQQEHDLEQSHTKQQQQLGSPSFPTAIHHVRLRHVPLLGKMGTQEARRWIVGRFPALQTLNASPVTEWERKEAARQYLRQRQIQRDRLEGSKQSMKTAEYEEAVASQFNGTGPNLAQAPEQVIDQYWMDRYPDLASIGASGGGMNNVAGGDINKNMTLANTVVAVTIRSMASASCTIPVLYRRLPRNVTLGRLKALCARHFGLDIDLQSLKYVVLQSSDDGAMESKGTLPVAMPDDDATLDYYGIPDGAEIQMDEVDVTALQRERERQDYEQLQQRMDQQEQEMAQLQNRLRLHTPA